MKEKNRRPREYVFPHSRDKAAIVDKSVFSVRGELNETFRENEIKNATSKSIFHPGSQFAACIYGAATLTGNSVSIHHGKMVPFENVPDLTFTLHSETIPLTASQVELFIEGCTAGDVEVAASSLEVTFDFTGEDFERVRKNLLYRAHRVLVLTDDRGWKTFYVGSPSSSWQVRLYQKTSYALRLEFILRRGFLKRFGINRPQDILLLRKIDIWRLLSVRRYSRSSAKRVTRDWADAAARRAVLNWIDDGRSREPLLRILRENRTPAKLIFRRTKLQKRLEAMQKMLIW